MVKKLLAKWYKYKYRKSLQKAIKHANHMKCTTGYKCLVLLFNNEYKAITKQAVKQLLRQKYFKKGVTMQQLESMAAYQTN